MGEMKSYSEIKQEEAGTLRRNRFIQYLYSECHWRQVDIAKKFGFKRQRAFQIINRTYPEKHHIGLWRRLWDILTYPY